MPHSQGLSNNFYPEPKNPIQIRTLLHFKICILIKMVRLSELLSVWVWYRLSLFLVSSSSSWNFCSGSLIQ